MDEKDIPGKPRDNPAPAKTPAEMGEEASTEAQRALVEPPSEQVKKLQAEKQELLDTLVRRQADFENYRKRTEREKQQERQRGIESIIQHLLPVLDDFERALAAHSDPAYEEYRKGVQLIERRLWGILEKQGLKRIESVGRPFDPHLHHAIEQVETAGHAEGMITSELQAGYKGHDKGLRPAMVRVAKRPVAQEPAAQRGEN